MVSVKIYLIVIAAICYLLYARLCAGFFSRNISFDLHKGPCEVNIIFVLQKRREAQRGEVNYLMLHS